MPSVVPAGYSVDADDKQVTVGNAATCGGDPYVGESVSFANTPLTDLTVSVNSQADGGTASTWATRRTSWLPLRTVEPVRG